MNSGLKAKAMTGLHDKVIELVTRSGRTGDLILDIAAGTGALTQRLLELGHNVAANDLYSKDWGVPEVDLLRVDLNGRFSEEFVAQKIQPKHIVAVEVIEHLENPINFLRECRKLLSPDGFLIVTTPNINTIRGRFGFLKHGRLAYFNEREYSDSGHISILPWWLLCCHAKKAGFKDCEVRFGGRFELPDGLRERMVRIFSRLMAIGDDRRKEELLGGATVLVMRPGA